jgi:hypothetical protein
MLPALGVFVVAPPGGVVVVGGVPLFCAYEGRVERESPAVNPRTVAARIGSFIGGPRLPYIMTL